MYLVYKLTCTVNGKGYVGITCDLPRRLVEHQSPRSSCSALRNAIRKHGWDNFVCEVLYAELSKEEAIALEVASIVDHDTRIPTGYNITAGGEGALDRRYVMSDAHKRAIGAAHVGKKHTQQTKDLLRSQRLDPAYQDQMRQLRETEEYKQKRAASSQSPAMARERDRRATPEYREAAARRRAGISHDASRKQAIRLSMLQRTIDRIMAGEKVGVTYEPRSSTNPWIAKIRNAGKVKYIGSFPSSEEAAAAVLAYVLSIIGCDQASESLELA